MKRCGKVKFAQIRFTESSAAAFVEAFRHQAPSFSFQHMEALQFIADGPSTGEGSLQMALSILAVASPNLKVCKAYAHIEILLTVFSSIHRLWLL